MKTKRYYLVVVTEDRNIEAYSRENAERIYALYEHARIERWDMQLGTARTIKEK